MALDSREFGEAISEHDDSTRAAGDVDPTGGNAEVKKIRLIDVDGDVDGHVGHAGYVSVAASEQRQNRY